MTTFNNRGEFEQAISNLIFSNSMDYDIMANGDIVDTTQCERNDEGEIIGYDAQWAVTGNLFEDDYIDLCGGYKFDANYTSPLDLANEFIVYLMPTDADCIYITCAQTTSCYVSFEVGDNQYKVRFADHSDCYANSDFNCASCDDNGDGQSYELLIEWTNNLLNIFEGAM